MEKDCIRGVNLNLWRAFGFALQGIGLNKMYNTPQRQEKIIFNRMLFAEILESTGYDAALKRWNEQYDESMLPPHDSSVGQRFSFYEDNSTPGGRRLKRVLLGQFRRTNTTLDAVASAIHYLGGTETLEDSMAMLNLGDAFFATFGDGGIIENLRFNRHPEGRYDVLYTRESSVRRLLFTYVSKNNSIQL